MAVSQSLRYLRLCQAEMGRQPGIIQPALQDGLAFPVAGGVDPVSCFEKPGLFSLYEAHFIQIPGVELALLAIGIGV